MMLAKERFQFIEDHPFGTEIFSMKRFQTMFIMVLCVVLLNKSRAKHDAAAVSSTVYWAGLMERNLATSITHFHIT